MNKKIVISLIIISAIMLFSMQLCTILFGNKPIVTITLPASDQIVNTISLGVTGIIDDLDGDQTKVKVWIEDHTSIYAWDTGVTTGNFEVSLDLSSLSAGIYYVIAQGYDANNNVSDAVSVRFNYQPGGGSTSAPQVIITKPAQNTMISTSTFEVSGTISDPEGDQDHITYWVIRDSDNTIVISATDIDIATNNSFIFYPDFTDFPSGSYTIYIYGVDEALNVGITVSVTINYQPGGSYTNILLNGRFEQYLDNFSGLYETSSAVESYLNNSDIGDWLASWQMFIYTEYALDNKIKIDLDGSSIRYYSTQNDADGNAKFSLMQYIEHTITPNTTLYIRFKINSAAAGGTNPGEGELKLLFSDGAAENLFASFSSLTGDDNNTSIRSNLNVGQLYEFTLNLSTQCNIPLNTYLEYIKIFVNCHYFDVTIYEIAIYEN